MVPTPAGGLHNGGHWHTPRCLIVILWMGGWGRPGVAMVVVMIMSGVIFTIPLTIVTTNLGAMIIIVVMIVVIVMATRRMVSHMMWISIAMVTVAGSSPPTSSSVTPPTS